MRGRKPIPTALKELAGNPGKRALNKQEPKPESGIPTCPEHLTGPARTEWKRITAELLKLQLISQVDRAALTAYCMAWGDVVKATGKLKKEGEVIVSDKGGMYQNPWVAIRNSALERLIKTSAEFGMTPSSRTRVRIDQPPEQDQMSEFLFGNKRVKVTAK